LQAALTREQGQEFVIVLVKDYVVHDSGARAEMINFAEREFGVRAALITERSLRTFGPTDIVRWLEGIAIEQLPWAEYTFSPVS